MRWQQDVTMDMWIGQMTNGQQCEVMREEGSLGMGRSFFVYRFLDAQGQVQVRGGVEALTIQEALRDVETILRRRMDVAVGWSQAS